MSEESWHAARLIPTSGINGPDEQERRATSALLAVVGAVREFGRSLTSLCGAPAGAIETFVEVPFKLADKQLFPDGLIRVTRGQRVWTALVEVKTGSNVLTLGQVEQYLDVARDHGFDALITISNEIPPMPGMHPTGVDRRRLRRVGLYHLPWTEVLTQAVLQKEHRGVADPDQAWILGELVRYLEHPRSGALEFVDMGPAWTQVRDAITAGTLRSGDTTASEIAGRFDALIRYSCLRLGRRLGADVTPALTRHELADPVTRTQSLVTQLAGAGTMSGGLRIPGAISPLYVTADLRAQQIICHVDVDAPRSGRAATRVNWLARQLRNAPEYMRIEASTMHARGPGTAALLHQVRADPSVLISDVTKELRAFRVAQHSPAGVKRGTGRGAFIDSLLDAIDKFYEQAVSGLKPWMPAPIRPRSTEDVETEPVAESLISTALSSQDGSEAAGATTAPDPTSCDDVGSSEPHDGDDAPGVATPPDADIGQPQAESVEHQHDALAIHYSRG
jgi:hypothetical protein